MSHDSNLHNAPKAVLMSSHAMRNEEDKDVYQENKHIPESIETNSRNTSLEHCSYRENCSSASSMTSSFTACPDKQENCSSAKEEEVLQANELETENDLVELNRLKRENRFLRLQLLRLHEERQRQESLHNTLRHPVLSDHYNTTAAAAVLPSALPSEQHTYSKESGNGELQVNKAQCISSLDAHLIEVPALSIDVLCYNNDDNNDNKDANVERLSVSKSNSRDSSQISYSSLPNSHSTTNSMEFNNHVEHMIMSESPLPENRSVITSPTANCYEDEEKIEYNDQNELHEEHNLPCFTEETLIEAGTSPLESCCHNSCNNNSYNNNNNNVSNSSDGINSINNDSDNKNDKGAAMIEQYEIDTVGACEENEALKLRLQILQRKREREKLKRAATERQLRYEIELLRLALEREQNSEESQLPEEYEQEQEEQKEESLQSNKESRLAAKQSELRRVKSAIVIHSSLHNSPCNIYSTNSCQHDSINEMEIERQKTVIKSNQIGDAWRVLQLNASEKALQAETSIGRSEINFSEREEPTREANVQEERIPREGITSEANNNTFTKCSINNEHNDNNNNNIDVSYNSHNMLTEFTTPPSSSQQFEESEELPVAYALHMNSNTRRAERKARLAQVQRQMSSCVSDLPTLEVAQSKESTSRDDEQLLSSSNNNNKTINVNNKNNNGNDNNNNTERVLYASVAFRGQQQRRRGWWCGCQENLWTSIPPPPLPSSSSSSSSSLLLLTSSNEVNEKKRCMNMMVHGIEVPCSNPTVDAHVKNNSAYSSPVSMINNYNNIDSGSGGSGNVSKSSYYPICNQGSISNPNQLGVEVIDSMRTRSWYVCKVIAYALRHTIQVCKNFRNVTSKSDINVHCEKSTIHDGNDHNCTQGVAHSLDNVTSSITTTTTITNTKTTDSSENKMPHVLSKISSLALQRAISENVSLEFRCVHNLPHVLLLLLASQSSQQQPERTPLSYSHTNTMYGEQCKKDDNNNRANENSNFTFDDDYYCKGNGSNTFNNSNNNNNNNNSNNSGKSNKNTKIWFNEFCARCNSYPHDLTSEPEQIHHMWPSPIHSLRSSTTSFPPSRQVSHVPHEYTSKSLHSQRFEDENDDVNLIAAFSSSAMSSKENSTPEDDDDEALQIKVNKNNNGSNNNNSNSNNNNNFSETCHMMRETAQPLHLRTTSALSSYSASSPEKSPRSPLFTKTRHRGSHNYLLNAMRSELREDDVRVTFHAPVIFAQIRDYLRCNTDELRSAAGFSVWRQSLSPGKSGATLYYFGNYIVKTLKESEFTFFIRKLLPAYAVYCERNPHTFLSRFYAL